MKKTTILAGLTVSVLAFAGCGGGGATSTPSTAAPAGGTSSSSAAAPSPAETSSSPAATPSAADTPSADTGNETAADPCTVLSADEVSDLTGVEVKKGTSSTITGSKLCTWLPKEGTKRDAAVFTAQEGAARGGTLSDAEAPLKKQFGGDVTKTSVRGAEDARYITGKSSGANVIDVLALRGEIFYQVLAASPRSVDDHKDGVYKMAEALIKG